MFDLLRNKTFIIEEYEVKVVDKKGPPEVFHMERRWKVKFSRGVIASGFLSAHDAESYINKHASRALWNLLWHKGIEVNWDPGLEVIKFNVEFINKEQ